jgi:hypothetical protein
VDEKNRPSPLRIVADPGAIPPPPARVVGEHGRELWRRVHAEYAVDDVAGREMLTQACLGSDRAEALAACVAEQGEVLRTKTGFKAHPAIREEMACRAFVVRTLSRLGLNFEPIRTTFGRPPSKLR